MKIVSVFGLVVSAAVLSIGFGLDTQAQQQHPQSPNMTFFVTGFGPGKGADLGGLEGADRYCQELAQTRGAGGKTWRAYLSTQAAGGKPAVNARDRIGNGPWQNFKGEVVAKNVDDLHSDNNKLGSHDHADRAGPDHTGRRLRAEPPRRPHRLADGRQRVSGRRRSDLPQLDQQHPGRGDGRAISTARVCATTRRRGRGIRRIPRAGRTAAAARPICAAPAVTACSTASRSRAVRGICDSGRAGDGPAAGYLSDRLAGPIERLDVKAGQTHCHALSLRYAGYVPRCA